MRKETKILATKYITMIAGTLDVSKVIVFLQYKLLRMDLRKHEHEICVTRVVSEV
jgi:hypothetical protein